MSWLNHESPEFIRFMNPGDLRVAQQACGLCHDEIIRNVDHSMMNHGAMLWGAALYNNGGFYLKNYRFGQAYGADGAPLRLINYTPVTPNDTSCTASCRSSIRCRASILATRETSSASSKKAASKAIAARPPDAGRTARQTGAPFVRARTRHAQPHRSGFPRPAKNASARSAARLSRLERSSRAIIVRAAAPPATSFMRTIVRRRIPAGGASTATRD